jgi:uncharacterized surface protein with fasciclin (FAS1) repeats
MMVPSSKASKASKASKSAKGMKGMKGMEGMKGMKGNIPVNPPTAPPATTTITGFVESRSDLSSSVEGEPSLERALARAGFLQILDSVDSGTFTLFAPTNNAFAEVPSEFLEILFFQDAFIPHLQDLLLFHLLFGEFFASDLLLLSGDSLVAVNGENQPITNPPLSVSDVTIMEPDNDVTNGVVHIIGEVLAPSWVRNSIVSRVATDNDLSILSQLLAIASINGLDNIGGTGLTLLAPTNDAFNALPDGVLTALSAPENLTDLQFLLFYHLITGVVTVEQLQDGLQLPSVLGESVVVVNVISGQATTVNFNQSPLIGSTILAFSGVVLKIGAVLNPQDSPTPP